ncbi:MAG TPA: helix-turn-helix domain-containing protein [Solirubrobacteraceae bacterium]|nr:helix-turn-helix domain-containing protein [Solirubrobacteraceae bacterium]
MNTVARKRTYRMTARADAAQATGERILEAAGEVFWERPAQDISLEEVARRAGVTKQTVLRRFGSKAGLFAAAADREHERIRGERGEGVPGDVDGAVAALVAHYERLGDAVVRLLAEEVRHPELAVHADRGRAYHAGWCERAFAPALEGLGVAERERRLAQLITVTDVYAWKLLRRDRGLSRRATEVAMRELVEALAGARR